MLAERDAKLLTGRGVAVKNLDSSVSQVRDDTAFLPVPRVKETENAAGEARRDCPPEGKPEGAPAGIPEETRPEVGSSPV